MFQWAARLRRHAAVRRPLRLGRNAQLAAVIAQDERYGASVAKALSYTRKLCGNARTAPGTGHRQPRVKILFQLLLIFPAIFVVLLAPRRFRFINTGSKTYWSSDGVLLRRWLMLGAESFSCQFSTRISRTELAAASRRPFAGRGDQRIRDRPAGSVYTRVGCVDFRAVRLYRKRCPRTPQSPGLSRQYASLNGQTPLSSGAQTYKRGR